jgi:uncharacterized protein
VSSRLWSFVLVSSLAACAMNPIDSLIFFPDRSVPDPPPGVEERWITASDGTRLHAWYAGSPSRRATLVWSHGNGGNIAGRLPILLDLAARGLSVLAYDYRGYGKSEGRPSEQGVYLDAEAAYDSERARGVPPSRIVCFGESLGGAVSIRLATRRACAAVAVVSTFTTMRDVARVHYGPLAAFSGKRFDSLALVGEIAVPFFAAHGDHDEIVPFPLGERLFAAAKEPKRFLRVAGAAHNDIFDQPALLDALATFIAESVG